MDLKHLPLRIDGSRIYTATGDLFATVAHRRDPAEEAQWLRLIAAAPALLMALEMLLQQAEGFSVSGVYFNEFRENRDALDTAYDAIKKVAGQS